MEQEQKDKLILKWLHRVLEEENHNINNIVKRISILNHQIQNYKRMRDEIQEEVRENLFNIMGDLDWTKEINEIKKEFS